MKQRREEKRNNQPSEVAGKMSGFKIVGKIISLALAFLIVDVFFVSPKFSFKSQKFWPQFEAKKKDYPKREDSFLLEWSEEETKNSKQKIDWQKESPLKIMDLFFEDMSEMKLKLEHMINAYLDEEEMNGKVEIMSLSTDCSPDTLYSKSLDEYMDKSVSEKRLSEYEKIKKITKAILRNLAGGILLEKTGRYKNFFTKLVNRYTGKIQKILELTIRELNKISYKYGLCYLSKETLLGMNFSFDEVGNVCTRNTNNILSEIKSKIVSNRWKTVGRICTNMAVYALVPSLRGLAFTTQFLTDYPIDFFIEKFLPDERISSQYSLKLSDNLNDYVFFLNKEVKRIWKEVYRQLEGKLTEKFMEKAFSYEEEKLGLDEEGFRSVEVGR